MMDGKNESGEAASDTGVAASVVEQVKLSVGEALLRGALAEIQTLGVPWIITPEKQQQDIIDRMRMQIEHLVDVAVRRIASTGFESVPVTIDSLAIKDEAKAVLLLSRHGDGLHTVADQVGAKATLVFADPAAFLDNMRGVQAEADQRPLFDENERRE
jgi:hypothetical protein